MKNWFTEFENCLKGEKASPDLIGAGTADSNRAMAHYRYQHQAKMREAVEMTFPVLLRKLGSDWEKTWKEFWEQNEISPRSLDWFPEVFMNYFRTTDAQLTMKELARFENQMDLHPWTHQVLSLKTDIVLSEESKIILGNHEILDFEVSVTELYEENENPSQDKQVVLLWQKEDGVYYRAMKDWELRVFRTLEEGVDVALEHAPEDPEAVGEFFKWLGSSCLIQGLKQA